MVFTSGSAVDQSVPVYGIFCIRPPGLKKYITVQDSKVKSCMGFLGVIIAQ
jgi:hypothetical protein